MNIENYTRRANAGTLCLTILFQISTMSRHDSSADAALARFYCSNVDVICDWIGFSLRSGIGFRPGQHGSIHEISSPLELYMGYPLFLINLLSLRSPKASPSPSQASLNSPTFCNLIYQIWTAGDGKKECHIAVGEGKPCTIVSLMSTVLDTGGREEQRILMKYLGRDGFANFVQCAVRRVMYTSRIIAAQTTTLGMMGLVDTVGIIVAILAKLMPHRPALLRAMPRFQYLKRTTHFFRTAVRVSMKTKTQPSQAFLSLCTLTLQLVQLAQSSRSRLSQNWADIIAGGFLDVVRHALNSLSAIQEQSDTLSCTSALCWLNKYTTYPDVLFEYRRQYPNGLQDLQNMMNPGAAQAWADLRQNFVDRHALLRLLLDKDQGRVHARICDNIECPAIAVSDQLAKGRGPSRQCSRCSSVVYCSRGCQTEDWNRLHRQECCSAGGEQRSRRLSKGWYSYSSRAFHALLVSTVYEDDPSEPDGMMVLDYATTGEVRIDSRSIASWWDGKEFDSCQPPDRLRPRFEALMEKYTWSKQTLRIVEAVLPALGREGEIYLTLLLRKEGESFVSVFSVARYGSSDFETI